MSSTSSTVQPNTPITVKIYHNGLNKKVKLLFSDLSANTLEDKLREVLDIAPSVPCHFERYSDSAGRYGVLDRNNTSVYKQLIRAAKAKKKLKIRVVYPNQEQESDAAEPQPASESASQSASQSETASHRVTLEDVPDEGCAKDAALEQRFQKLVLDVPVDPAHTVDETPAPAAQSAAAAPQLPDPFTNMPKTVGEVTWSQMLRYMPDVASANPSPAPVPVPVLVSVPEPAMPRDEKVLSSGNTTVDATEARSPTTCAAPVPPSAICCNSCNRRVPNEHYHCSTCFGGDFDLCKDCINAGVTCYNPEHWLIRRDIQNGIIVNSRTERIRPKRKSAPSSSSASSEPAPAPFPRYADSLLPTMSTEEQCTTPQPSNVTCLFSNILNRTCNNCIRSLPERDFLHCAVCEDFDLCQSCFAKDNHGHHPEHAFAPAVQGTRFDWNITRRLPAGRGKRHNAVCDGCEKFITGVRHKCLNCPDWDYCSECFRFAEFNHPSHRFAPIYTPLHEAAGDKTSTSIPAIHTGIYCDGPGCAANGRNRVYITGDRYKCAVCNDKDFCANCEASPSNTHNKSHPLIKFRTPVRHVSVTTTGEHGNGAPMPVMGDSRHRPFHCHRNVSGNVGALQMNKVQTVLDVQPMAATKAEPKVEAKVEPKVEPKVESKAESKVDTTAKAASKVEEHRAGFVRDTVADGTLLPPNHVFQQTWILRNTGKAAWPAGCCVRFVGGDYMGHVDPNHPAGIQELVSASESTICYEPLAPGAEFPFTVVLRTPSRLGKAISFWRLTADGGVKFGDRLWCDVMVEAKPEKVAEKVAEKVDENVETAAPIKAEEKMAESSQMIFPKLDKESPVSSIHEPEPAVAVAASTEGSHADYDEWVDDDSDSGFLTDEEYDILDASDEEFVHDKAALKK